MTILTDRCYSRLNRLSHTLIVNRTVETISRALLNQEKRSRYVSRQVALMLRLQEEAAQRGSQNQVSNAQQQSIHVSNESSATVKKIAPVSNGHSSNEMNLSARKKNKSGDALQQSLISVVVPALEGASRSSNPSSIAATPTSRSSSAALEVPIPGPPGTITVSPSPTGALPLPLPVSGVWTVSPQRAASPPVPSSDATVNVPTSAVDKDVAGSIFRVSHDISLLALLPAYPVSLHPAKCHVTIKFFNQDLESVQDLCRLA